MYFSRSILGLVLNNIEPGDWTNWAFRLRTNSISWAQLVDFPPGLLHNFGLIGLWGWVRARFNGLLRIFLFGPKHSLGRYHCYHPTVSSVLSKKKRSLVWATWDVGFHSFRSCCLLVQWTSTECTLCNLQEVLLFVILSAKEICSGMHANSSFWKYLLL